METNKEFDILEMPVDGLAAYWLSLKKILDTRKGKNLLKDELGSTGEPFIKFLLETVFSNFEISHVRKLAKVKRALILSDYRKKIDLMRLCLYAVAASENPRVTLVRMDSKFSSPPMDERKAFDLAHGMIRGMSDNGVDLPTLLRVDHKLKPDRLIVKLLFYVITSRREGKHALTPHVHYDHSPYFSEGLSLAVDGFEADFLAHHLMDIRNETIIEVGRKMDMALEMALGIRKKMSYDDIYRTARAFML